MPSKLSLRRIARKFVLVLASLLLSAHVQAAQAEEPIQKALGQTLGAVFDAASAIRSSGGGDVVNFWYSAPMDTPALTEFYVGVTPLTYRIFAIKATGEQAGRPECEALQLAIFEMISKKYNGDKYGGEMRELEDGGGYFLVQSKLHRMISVECREGNGKTKLELAYLDGTVHDSAKQEEEEIVQLSSAFQAKNYAQILPRVQDLARQGNLWAETMLGLMYGQGLGVPHDDDAAEDHYLRAAQRGWLGAEYNLGTFYYKRFRYKPAETWLLKAAQKEYPEAEENLAQLYLANGPLQSEERAFTWFLQAAEHGRPESQYNTCYDYADGLGVKRDMTEAYKWCYIAARNGQKQADANKDHLAAQMRPDEVARGREAAERWLAQKRFQKP